MSDFDPQPDDELVSAYLDGEATAEEVARVEREPALRARAAELSAIASSVGARVQPDAATREAHLRRASEEHAATSADADAIDLAAERSKRKPRALVLGIAAALLVILLGVAVAVRLASDDEPVQVADEATEAGGDVVTAPTSTIAPRAEEDSATGDAAAPEAQDSSGVTAFAPTLDLGAFASREELGVAVTRAVDEHLTAANPAPSATLAPDDSRSAAQLREQSCVDQLLSIDDELASLELVASASLAGEPVTILLFALHPTSSANGPFRLYVINAASCVALPNGVQTIDP